MTWTAPAWATVYDIPNMAGFDPTRMAGARLEVGIGIVRGLSPPVEDGTSMERFLARDARQSVQRTFQLSLGAPIIETWVVRAKNRGGGSSAEGVAFRDGLVIAMGTRTSIVFGYEMMLGYRAAGFGLLVGAMGQYADMMTRGGDFGWRVRYQGRLEIPCPWARIPFQLNPHWERHQDGSYGVQVVIPLNWSFSLYATFQHVTAVSRDVENGVPVSMSAEGRQILFGLNSDMPEHFHVRRPRAP